MRSNGVSLCVPGPCHICPAVYSSVLTAIPFQQSKQRGKSSGGNAHSGKIQPPALPSGQRVSHARALLAGNQKRKSLHRLGAQQSQQGCSIEPHITGACKAGLQGQISYLNMVDTARGGVDADLKEDC